MTLIHAPNPAHPPPRPHSTDPTTPVGEPVEPAIDALARTLATRNPAAAALLGRRLLWHAEAERRRRVGAGVGIVLSVSLETGVLAMGLVGEITS